MPNWDWTGREICDVSGHARNSSGLLQAGCSGAGWITWDEPQNGEADRDVVCVQNYSLRDTVHVAVCGEREEEVRLTSRCARPGPERASTEHGLPPKAAPAGVSLERGDGDGRVTGRRGRQRATNELTAHPAMPK